MIKKGTDGVSFARAWQQLHANPILFSAVVLIFTNNLNVVYKIYWLFICFHYILHEMCFVQYIRLYGDFAQLCTRTQLCHNFTLYDVHFAIILYSSSFFLLFFLFFSFSLYPLKCIIWFCIYTKTIRILLYLYSCCPLPLFILSVIWALCNSFVTVYSVYGLTILQHLWLYNSHDLCYIHWLTITCGFSRPHWTHGKVSDGWCQLISLLFCVWWKAL